MHDFDVLFGYKRWDNFNNRLIHFSSFVWCVACVAEVEVAAFPGKKLQARCDGEPLNLDEEVAGPQPDSIPHQQLEVGPYQVSILGPTCIPLTSF